jgi:hypothetical protein
MLAGEREAFNAPAAKHVARPAFPDEADRRGEKSQR